MMQIENKTEYSTAELEKLFGFVEVPLERLKVIVDNCYLGPELASGEIAIYEEPTVIRLQIRPDIEFPCSIKRFGKYLKFKKQYMKFKSWQEILLFMFAHEVAHIWQKKEGALPVNKHLFCEECSDKYALRILRRYRNRKS
jgi:hypothetical protein